MKFSEGIEPGPDGSLPQFDELQYVYYAPEMERGEAEGDYYCVVGFKDGKGLFSGLIAAGNLERIVGPVLTTKMVLGQGDAVKTPNVSGESNPPKSLQVHSKEITEMDQTWLKQMGVQSR